MVYKPKSLEREDRLELQKCQLEVVIEISIRLDERWLFSGFRCAEDI